MEFLVLANNKFSGTIPKCLGNFSSGLNTMDLRNNEFQGTIPTNFSKDIKLKNIGLNGNNLVGPLPQSIKNCKYLEVLDVGNNKIYDTFPIWLDNLPQLHVLILRSNKFYGTVIPSKTQFEKLRIVDLSYNNFTGSLPAQFLKNLPAMMSVRGEDGLKYMGDGNGSYYLDSVTLIMKGLEMEIHRVLSIFTTIDLSGNKFEGEIPESIGNLYALKLLNLSHNNFNGLIPPALGRLDKLESLDLSWNQFRGEIPSQLTNLTSLGTFNVSENQLRGRIPTGNQFGAFSNDSYYGNLGLCGFPLKDCGPNKDIGYGSNSGSGLWERDVLGLESGFSWKPVVLGYSFGMSISLAIVGFSLVTGKPKWMMNISEEISRQLGIRSNRKRYVMIGISVLAVT